jgi:hypothetical protein
VTICDGGFDLTVHVSSQPGPPQSVSCEVIYRREAAEQVLEHLAQPPPQRGPVMAVTADPFAGEPLTVHVPVSWWESMSGRRLTRPRPLWLVVIAVLPDGRRVGKLVEVPDRGATRQVSVELP